MTPALTMVTAVAFWSTQSVALAASHDFPIAGDRATLITPHKACRTLEAAKRLTALLDDRDNVAVAAFVRDQQPLCASFEHGIRGRVEENADWHELRCFRPDGSAYCYWFAAYLLQPDIEER